MSQRLEALWCDTPAAIAERDPSASNLRGCNPPGFPEVAVLGNGTVDEHFGLSGQISVAGPLNWHEEASLGWHPDGAYDGKEENVLTLFACYDTPNVAPAGRSHQHPPLLAIYGSLLTDCLWIRPNGRDGPLATPSRLRDRGRRGPGGAHCRPELPGGLHGLRERDLRV